MAHRRSNRTKPNYPRSARVNEILREILADELERMQATDDRLGILTITAVQCEPDLRRALVLLSSMTKDEEEALADVRTRLQAAISRQVRMKRTPLLRFAPDPAVATGQRIEDILRELPEVPESPEPPGSADGPGPVDPAER